MLEFLINNIFAMIGGRRVFQQTVGISLGTNRSSSRRLVSLFVCIKSSRTRTSATCGAGTAYHPEAPEFAHVF